MIHGVDPSGEQFLLDMQSLDKRIERVQRQISSGLRIQSASDDPDQISNLLRTRAEMAQNNQVRDDLKSYKLEADIASDALTRANQVLEKVKALNAQGITGALDAAATASLVEQVEGFMQEMTGIAATKVNGRYIFSGDKDQTAPYTIDYTQPNGVSAYAGSASTRQARHPEGTLIPVAQTADSLFDSATPGESVFSAMASLRQGLLDGDSTAIQNALDSVQSAEQHLRGTLVLYGNVQNRIAAAGDEADRKDVRLEDQLSSIQETDVTAAIVELKDLQFDRDASLSARAKLPKTSLFDYLA